eukprot:6209363-Pleurochrysis_carterae.AAC.1
MCMRVNVRARARARVRVLVLVRVLVRVFECELEKLALRRPLLVWNKPEFVLPSREPTTATLRLHRSFYAAKKPPHGIAAMQTQKQSQCANSQLGGHRLRAYVRHLMLINVEC